MTLLLVVKTFATSDKYLYFAFGTVSCKEFILKCFTAIEVRLFLQEAAMLHTLLRENFSIVMITVTFCIRLKTNCLCDFFGRIINSLNFTPSKMDVFYNEFSTPQFFIKYNPQLPDLLSLAEVDGGITSFSLYDNK